MKFVLILVAARDKIALTEAMVRRIREHVAGTEPVWLSPGEAAEIPCMVEPEPELVAAALDYAPVDALCVKSRGRRKAVLVADMDSTIVTSETLDEVAGEAGIKDRIAAITARSMAGEVEFAAALRERVALLEGLDIAALERTWRRTEITPGARELVATMRAHGATTALVSGGFTWFTARVAAELGFDIHRANTLLDDGSRLTGKVAEPVLDRDAKRAALHEIAEKRGAKLGAVMAVGDGANDLAMLADAGMGVAYHAKPIVTAQAKLRVDHADLRALLFAQGYPASVFRS
ncbi:phosphoserine phosphatase SerB [Acidiphilium iwatense]|uniref:Phosphoserine phosphatase n=1 Tax=Acidiphilium iwatense TaxID=768198 RepID=A0ABS9DWU1_9PROT|nr:phosphoserine phosphatase SerB [Acidiphilium iwatense]MCF3945794.1 phosphoserine phosphatase SerB [Acidiphilium iwatense]